VTKIFDIPKRLGDTLVLSLKEAEVSSDNALFQKQGFCLKITHHHPHQGGEGLKICGIL